MVPAAPGTTTGTAATSARASLSVAGWTLVSRITGLLRVAAIAAVLGPTYLGNIFQATNLLPNIVFDLLAGSLFTSLLVPALVSHSDKGNRQALERLAGGFLGVVLALFFVITLVLVSLAPLVVGLFSLGVDDPAVAAAQGRTGTFLLLLVAPQLCLYGLVGTAWAVQNAQGRFAFPAAAPAIENVLTIGVMIGYAMLFQQTDLESVETGQLLWLGLGSTLAVAVHAAVQWYGARRSGVTLIPHLRMRDPEIIRILRLSVPSLGFTGLNAARMMTVLIVASSVPGGVVAFQIAYNFYSLPEALVARPVAQSFLPELSRSNAAEVSVRFVRTLTAGGSLAVFFIVPAAAGLLALGDALAAVVSNGNMDSADGRDLVQAAIIGLALGSLAQALIFVGSSAFFARQTARTPFWANCLRALMAMAGLIVYFVLDEEISLLVVGLIVSVADLAGLLLMVLLLGLQGLADVRALGVGLMRASMGALLMGLAADLAVDRLGSVGTPSAFSLVVGVAVGLVVYVTFQWVTRSPEIRVMSSAIRSSAK
ncbi:murein biosynthesis integral membrane protein MurJ [Blastococcus sp. SYSU DS0753]